MLFLYKPGVSMWWAWLGRGRGGERGVAAVGAGTPLGVLESAGSLSTSGTWVQTGLAPLRGSWGASAVMWGWEEGTGGDVHVPLFQKKKKRKKYGCNGEFSIFLFCFLKLQST